MKFEVTGWWYIKEQTKAQKFNWTLVWEKVFIDPETKTKYPEAIGKNLYNAGKLDIAGYALFGEKVRETEKAIQVTLSFWNLNKAGRYVTDSPIETKWKTWIPKSVLI